jgi:hypothetical protein
MVLDGEHARTLDCSTCDYNLQINRNCFNNYSPCIIKLNDEIYRQCPRSIIMNQRELRYLVDLYFDCRENKRLPFNGSLLDQTAFTQDFFDYADGIVNTYRNKKHKEQEAQLKKSQQSTGKKTK